MRMSFGRSVTFIPLHTLAGSTAVNGLSCSNTFNKDPSRPSIDGQFQNLSDRKCGRGMVCCGYADRKSSMLDGFPPFEMKYLVYGDEERDKSHRCLK